VRAGVAGPARPAASQRTPQQRSKLFDREQTPSERSRMVMPLGDIASERRALLVCRRTCRPNEGTAFLSAQSLRSARPVALSHVPLSAPQSGIARWTSSAGTCGCNAITVGAPNLSNALCNRLRCLRPKERKQIPFGRPPHIRFPVGRDGARGCARVGHREIPAAWVW
jgi:hypothetical protein